MTRVLNFSLHCFLLHMLWDYGQVLYVLKSFYNKKRSDFLSLLNFYVMIMLLNMFNIWYPSFVMIMVFFIKLLVLIPPNKMRLLNINTNICWTWFGLLCFMCIFPNIYGLILFLQHAFLLIACPCLVFRGRFLLVISIHIKNWFSFLHKCMDVFVSFITWAQDLTDWPLML